MRNTAMDLMIKWQDCRLSHESLMIIIIIIIGFFINMRYNTEAISTSVDPFPGSCHGRSHTRSPGVSIMRVDSHELPLSAIPLCQLQSHLAPPRPILSINLYVIGCLDCTLVAFHMSIPAEPSLLQDEIQVFNAKPCK